MLFKDIIQSFNNNLFLEKKFILNNYYCKYYIKEIVKIEKSKKYYIDLDDSLLLTNSCVPNKFFTFKKIKKKTLTAKSISLKKFKFKSKFEQNKTFELPYFSFDKCLKDVIFKILKKKYVQVFSKKKNSYNFAKTLRINRGGNIIKTVSGLKGFLRRNRRFGLRNKNFRRHSIVNKLINALLPEQKRFVKLFKSKGAKKNSFKRIYKASWLPVNFLPSKKGKNLDFKNIINIFSKKKDIIKKKNF